MKKEAPFDSSKRSISVQNRRTLHSLIVGDRNCSFAPQLRNIQSHQNKIDCSSLPRTFQDVITVAQELGVFYIWVDSLCIIQDDENDWARHAEQMDKIYENALFVVAATSSWAASVPFLGADAPTIRDSYRAVNFRSTAQDNPYTDDPTLATQLRRHHGRLLPEWIRGPLGDRAWA